MLQSVRSTFRAIVIATVPEAACLGDSEWNEVEVIVESAVAKRPPALQRQLLLFIRLLNVLPVVRWGRSFRRLDPDRQARFLGALERSRLFVLRRGFWGVRTLAFMGYYARPAAYVAVGYDARLRGWLEHPAATPEARAASTASPGPAGGSA